MGTLRKSGFIPRRTGVREGRAPSREEAKMSTRFRTVTTAAFVAALLVTGCDDNDEDGGAGRIVEPIALAAFRVEIQGVELPQDGAPVLTFRVTEGEAPIENLGERIKNGVATQPDPPAEYLRWVSAPRVVLSRLDPATGDYLSYYARPQTGRETYRLPGTTTDLPRAQESADQATFDQAPTDAALDTRLTHQGGGVYRYTLAPLPAGAAVDRGATHTAGVWMTSHPSATEEQPSTDTHNFVPAGGTPQLDEVVTLAACNRCHAPAVEAHDARLGTQVCLTCHSPQSTDPETGNTVDFKVMIHKIHYGGELSGSPYHIVGFRPPGDVDPTSGVHVYSGEFINDVRDCALCHQGEDADRWKRNASLAACTSCHDNLRFDASATTECSLTRHDTEPCRHRLQVSALQRCSVCHTADQAQVGVATVHVPLRELQKRFRYEIVDVAVGDDPGTTDVAETRAPTVRFRVLKPDGQPYDLATAPEYTSTGASLTAIFAWPSQEYTNEGVPLPATGAAPSPGQPLRAAIVSGTPPALSTSVRPVSGQAGTYEVTGPQIPETASMPVTAAALGGAAQITSATVHLEGHPIVDGEEIPVENALRHFPLSPGGEVKERRQVVDVAKCDACHGYLSAHGRNRNNVIPVCVECHNPSGTDLGRRTAASAACPPASEASIDFKTMIHTIHAADIRREPVTICGFGGTPHTFPGALPHGVANCNLCHVNDGFRVPASDSPLPLDTVVATNGTPVDQSDDTRAPRVRAVCTSCHDQTRFDAGGGNEDLPACNTLPETNGAPCRHSAGLGLGVQTCFECHGPGQQFDVAIVHPVR
jgi:OmcA/MtrC family decaheme c-type cytochrome